jgi:CBS domain-containing membrane protein
MISAIVGVTVKQIFMYANVNLIWLQCSLSVSTALLLMQVTGNAHPPGGATALIAVVGGREVYQLGYWFVLMPVLAGMFILLAVACLIHKAFGRRYPTYWWDGNSAKESIPLVIAIDA